MTDVAETHDLLRPLMFSIAYRMLGSVVEAEDVVQEAFIRLQVAYDDGQTADSPEAYATTVTTRLAIDTLRSARVRRERYVGSWLPEPLLADDANPLHQLELSESVSYALLIVLERLSPEERAVFLLREVFAYGYPEIATIIDKAEANCRQLLVRARRHLADEKAAQRTEQPSAQSSSIASAFFAAVENGDLAGLEAVLAEGVRAVGDGGGKAPAVARAIEGLQQVTRFMLGLGRMSRKLGISIETAEANGQPAGLVRTEDGLVLGVIVLDIADGHIVGAYNQINPDKLGHLGPIGDLRGLMTAVRDPN